MISGQESRYRNLPSTLAHDEGNIASERTSDRLRREAAEVAMHKASHPPEHPWVVEARAEEAQKAAIRAEKIRSGKLVIHPDGSYTEKL